MSLLRELNHWRIDSSKALLLRIIRSLFDHRSSLANSKKLPDFKNVSRILVLHFDDKIGDLVINSSIFRELKKYSPQAKIDLVTGRNASPLVLVNPHIHKIILFKKGLFPTLKLARTLQKNKYDLVIDLRLMTDSRTIYILNQLGRNPDTFCIGLNKMNHAVYDFSTEKDFRSLHSKERVRTLLNSIGILSPDLSYDLYYSKQDLELAQKALARLHSDLRTRFIILNPFAGARFRSFQIESIRRISAAVHTKYPDHFIVLTGSPNDREFLMKCAQEQSMNKVHYLSEVKTLTELCALVAQSDGVITPDTSLVHIASAFDKSIIAFFRDDTGEQERNSLQWAPTSSHSKVILCTGRTNGYLDVNTFEDQDLINSLTGFINAGN